MPDVFSPEWMPLYWGELITDVADLTLEQLGAYMLLLGWQWQKGGIPRDVVAQANIAHMSTAKMRKTMERFGDRFKPHPSNAGLLVNEFMERVREEQLAKYLRYSNAGKAGANKRHGIATSIPGGNASSDASSDASSNATGDASSNRDIETREYHLASLDDTAGARALDRSKKSPAFEFALWMHKQGIESGAVPADRALDPLRWALPQVESAEFLLAQYGEEECRLRAERLIKACAQRRIRKPCTASTLRYTWDWDEVSGVFAIAGGAQRRNRYEADVEDL